MSHKKARIMLLSVFIIPILIICLMILAGNMTRQQYSGPGETENEHMVNIFESGLFREQVMCADKCVIFRTPGVHSFQVSSIVIGGKKYSNSTSSSDFRIGARGIYCPGAIRMMFCFELLVSENVCPDEIGYMGFRAPLVRDSCIIAE